MSLKTPLKKARDATDLTQWQVCVRVGIDQSHFSRLERGAWGCGSVVAAKIAKIFARQGINELHILYPRRYRAFKPLEAR